MGKEIQIKEILAIVLIVALILVAPFGWFSNIYKLMKCDFKAPYKAEVIRIIGIPIAPVGVIAGYINLGK